MKEYAFVFFGRLMIKNMSTPSLVQLHRNDGGLGPVIQEGCHGPISLGVRAIAVHACDDSRTPIVGSGCLGKRKNINRTEDLVALVNQHDLVNQHEEDLMACDEQQIERINSQLDGLWRELGYLSGKSPVRPAKKAVLNNSQSPS